MTRFGEPALRRSATTALVLAAAILPVVSHRLLAAPETIRIFIPAAVAFSVFDVSANTTGTPNPTTVSYDLAVLTGNNKVRISVKADSNFTPPSGTAIPASNVSWVTSGPVNGNGANGTLSTTAYNTLFQSLPNRLNGSVNVVWTLAAPGTSIRAGNHTMTMRWKFEAF